MEELEERAYKLSNDVEKKESLTGEKGTGT